MLATLLLTALSAGPLPAPEGASATDSVHVRVTRGRGALLRGGKLEVLTRSPQATVVPEAAVLELGPGAEAELLWPALASLRVVGPATLSVEGGRPSAEIERLASIEVEVRRESFVLELPDAWALEARPSAFGLEHRTGGIQVRLHGGPPLRVRSRIPRRRGDWPRWIAPGKPALLPRSSPRGD